MQEWVGARDNKRVETVSDGVQQRRVQVGWIQQWHGAGCDAVGEEQVRR
jgi:hypothetical protein